MKLESFPRPPKDNGRGVHGSLSPYWDSAGKQEWSFWAEQLKAMGICWYKVIDDGGGSARQLVMRLLDLDIMPVIRFYRREQNPGSIGDRGAKAVKEYVAMGAPWIETNNEPDLDLEWVGGKKPENWLDIVVDDWIADADIVLGLGGYVAIPAFGVGTLKNPYEKIVERGRQDILDNGAWASLHNYCLGRPMEYPNDYVNLYGEPLEEGEWEEAGGMIAWEMGPEAVNLARMNDANPDADIMTDATCFRAFEQLNQIIVDACGHSLPVLTTEGGYSVLQRAGTTFGDDARYPKPTPYHASRLNLEMFEYMQGDSLILGRAVPDYYFACMPWLIAVQRMFTYAPPAENQGPWFTDLYNRDWGLHGELPIVQMLKDLPSSVRQDGPVPAPWVQVKASDQLGDAWDDRLDYIGVKFSPYLFEERPAWRLVDARWLDETESGGQASIFVKALDESGNPLEGVEFFATRDGGEDVAMTKGAVDGYWGNIALYGGLGTYRVSMGERSDKVLNVGYGVEIYPHAPAPTSFRLTFRQSMEVPPTQNGLDEVIEKMRGVRAAWREIGNKLR